MEDLPQLKETFGEESQLIEVVVYENFQKLQGAHKIIPFNAYDLSLHLEYATLDTLDQKEEKESFHVLLKANEQNHELLKYFAKSAMRLFIWWDHREKVHKGTSVRLSPTVAITAKHCVINKKKKKLAISLKLASLIFAPVETLLPALKTYPDVFPVEGSEGDGKPDLVPSGRIWTSPEDVTHPDFAFLSIPKDGNPEFFLIPDSEKPQPNDPVFLLGYHSQPDIGYVAELTNYTKEEHNMRVLTNLIKDFPAATFDTVAISPGIVLEANERMLECSYSSFRSSSGGVVVRVRDPATMSKTFCAINVGNFSAPPSNFSIAVWNPAFVKAWVKTVLPSLPRNEETQILVKKYLLAHKDVIGEDLQAQLWL